LVVRDDDQRFL
jgi:hypothetical protein